MAIHKPPANQFFIGSLSEPPSANLSEGWKYTLVHDFSCGGFSNISIHVSMLEPGTVPHEVHSHEDEEILFILSGTLEVIRGNPDEQEVSNNPVIEKNGFVYHSREYRHTLRALGGSDAHYLVLRWNRNKKLVNGPSPFCVTLSRPDPFPINAAGFQIQPVVPLQVKTGDRIRAHYSCVQPGAGYGLHKDRHNVLIIIYEGIVEFIGKKEPAPAVAFFASGFPHSLKNPGNIPANYIAFELED